MRHVVILVAGVVVLVVGIFLLASSPRSTTATGEGNFPIVVDDDGYTGIGTSMAIGTDGFPVISYSRLTSGDLKVAHCGSLDCSAGNTLTTVDSAGSVGEASSIAIGTDGYPVVSYWDNGNTSLKLVHCGNASCASGNTITTVDNNGSVGQYTSIVIGTDGNPVVSYYDGTNKDLKVAHCGNVTCTAGNTLTTVDSSGDVGWYTSIAIGTDGNPIVSYLDLTNSDLKVAHCGNANCSSGNTITTVDNAPGAGWHSSITIGTDGKAIISYNDFTNEDLKLLHCGNVSCTSGNTIATVDSAGRTCCSTSVALDTAGNPVISYRDQNYSDLKIAQCGNPTCTSGNTLTAVDGPGMGGLSTSIAVGTDGNPVISYFALFDANLFVLHCPDSDCTVKPPTPTPAPTITLTPTITPTITQTPTITPTPAKQPEPGDTDGDGCSDQQENGPDEALGGLRDYLNPHDFYDVNGDQIIDLSNDIFGVILHYAPTGTEPEYDVNYDRGPTTGPNPWNMTAPDGVIDLSIDILGVIQQYNHSCQ